MDPKPQTEADKLARAERRLAEARSRRSSAETLVERSNSTTYFEARRLLDDANYEASLALYAVLRLRGVQ